MRDLVVHESGAVIDLAAPGEHEGLLRAIMTDRETSGRTMPKGVLRCYAHRAPLYLQTRRAVVTACHFPGSGFASHPVALMSTEHKVQVEYCARAADREGLDTEREVSLPTGVRPDLVIGGTTAVEVQRSRLKVGAAKARTTKAVRGGMGVSLWLSDKAPEYAPAWLYQVPSATVFAREWNTLPPLGSATVTGGVRNLVAKKCCPPTTFTCIENRYRRYCGLWHVDHEPLLGVSLDALTVGVATRVYVPAVVRGQVVIAPVEQVREHDAWWIPPAAADEQPAPDVSPARLECRVPVTVSEKRPLADWRGHSVGVSQPCHYCKKPAMMRDHLGRPCHKVCAEYDSKLELWS